jgi:histidyl-tRNA synthetase
MFTSVSLTLVTSALTIRPSLLRSQPLLCRAGARTLVASAAGGRTSAAVTQSQQPAAAGGKPFDLNPPRGTRDFYPEDMALRSWLFGHFREVARLHSFEEYDAPVLETEQLYVRKAGEDVTSQLYSLEDRSGRRLSLRPEMTPSLARMVLARQGGLPMPLKWFSIPQCWRYERLQRGRRREHYQWNMDVWGVPGVQAELELLAASVGFMKRVGLSAADVGIRLSTRAVLAELLSAIGVPDERFASTCVLIDKLDKLPAAEVAASLTEAGLAPEAVDTLLSTLGARDFASLEAAMGADSAAVAELRALFEMAEA